MPSTKLTGERRKVIFEFGSDLDFGEGITSAYVDVTVGVGSDDSPRAILFDSPEIVGTRVEQVVAFGVAGTIYSIECKIVSTTSKTYSQSQPLAVLQSVDATPPIVGEYLSSRPYPVIFVESLDHGTPGVEGGELRLVLQPQYLTEQLDHGMYILSGQLRDVIQTTIYPSESIDHSMSVISGVLRNLPIYSLNESINHSMSIMSGSLKDLILYDRGVDSLNHSMSILSGTLA